MENDASQLGFRLSRGKHSFLLFVSINAGFSSIVEDPHSNPTAYSYYGDYAS